MDILVRSTRNYINLTPDFVLFGHNASGLGFRLHLPNAIVLNAEPEGLQDTAEITVWLVFQYAH
jgi:hypothetical protein